MQRVVHILYSGVGGQGGVVFPLAAAARGSAESFAIFYGVEPMAEANIRRCEALGLTWRAWQKQPGFDLRQQREMAAWIAELDADAVIAHNLAVLPACLMARRKRPGLRIMAVEHHCNALKGRQRWILSALAPWIAHSTVYLTESYRDEVRAKLGWKLRRSGTAVIPNALDLDAYPQASPPPGKPFTIGMQGRMVDGKDFSTLIRAIALANSMPGPPLRLELAGDGPRRAECEALAASLGVTDAVHFTGLLDHPGLIRVMSGWNVYAHSSDGETMSIAIMEARACGLPVIASDAPGVAPYVRPEVDGLLAPTRDAAAFAAAFRRLADSPDVCTRMAAASRSLAAAEYSADRAWRAYSAQLFPGSEPVQSIEPISLTV